MTFLQKIPFYLILFYPFLGYLTIKVFGVPPFYVLTVLAVLIFSSKLSRRINLIFPRYLIILIAYMISLVFSIYVANENSFQLDSNLAQVLYVFLAFIFFLMIENTTFTTLFINKSKLIIYVIILAAALTSIIQYFSPSFFLNSAIYSGYDPNTIGYERRIMSIFTWGDFNASQYIAISFVILYGILLYEYKQKTTHTIILATLVGFVALTCQFRIALLTYLITTAVLLIKRISIKSILYIIVIIGLFYFLIKIIGFDVNYFFESRIMSDSALTRVEAFRAFYYAFPEKPFFGTGGVRTQALFDGFGYLARLHNVHLGIAYYYGIFASIFHTIFIIYLLRKTLKTGKEINYWPPFVGVLCFIAATMTMPRGEFLQPGIILMLVYDKYYNDIYKIKKHLRITSNLHVSHA